MSTEHVKLDDPLQRPFLRGLVALVRAEDRYGAWERKSDADLLAPFVVSKLARRAIPVVGDPSPEGLARVAQFYKAVCSRIEQRTGLMASPVLALEHEGFGRLVLTVGKLVAYARTLRDVHRFGFEDLATLEAEGEKVVAQALQSIEGFPEAARA
jgi:probable nitrogen fixation protein